MLAPLSKPSFSRSRIPTLLCSKAVISSLGSTLCRSTLLGTTMPCGFPSVLIHIHRALWMCPAIIRTVRRGAPGTLPTQSSSDKCSMRNIVTRLLVRHAAMIESCGFRLGLVALGGTGFIEDYTRGSMTGASRSPSAEGWWANLVVFYLFVVSVSFLCVLFDKKSFNHRDHKGKTQSSQRQSSRRSGTTTGLVHYAAEARL